MFLIKPIFLVIVNKEPHSKKVPLLLFQFPSPPIWNNWLSHLLNLYSFVITSHLNLFSSFSPLLSSTSSLFFSSLSLSLSRPYEAKEWRPTTWWQPVLGLVLAGIGPNQRFWCLFQSKPARICMNRPVSAQIKKKDLRIGVSVHVGCGCGCGGLGAAPLLPRISHYNLKLNRVNFRQEKTQSFLP